MYNVYDIYIKNLKVLTVLFFVVSFSKCMSHNGFFNLFIYKTVDNLTFLPSPYICKLSFFFSNL